VPSLSGASRHASQSPVTTDGQSVKPYWYQAAGKVCDLGTADVGSRVRNP